MPRGLGLPLGDALQRRQGVVVPADLTARGVSLAPKLPAPTKVLDDPTSNTFDTTRLTEAFTFPVEFAAAGAQTVLKRTNNPRLGLLIVNTNIAAGIFYCFDTEVNNNMIPIVSGGNRLFDVNVPQGDLNIFASGAGLVVVEYQLQSLYSR